MAFEFFRKYQRPILFTAGIFALVTFSVTGPLFSFFDWMFAPPYAGATMTLADGSKIRITGEDAVIGQELANGKHYPAVALPDLPVDQEEGDQRSEIYAALRALARHAGIEPSMQEVDAAIQQAVRIMNSSGADVTASQLAVQYRHASLDAWRRLVAEALRISTFLRVHALAADTTDAAIVQDLLRGREVVTFQVASLDKRKLEESLKAKGVSDDELQAWLDKLGDAEKLPYRHQTNLVALEASGFLLDAFDPAEHAAELTGKEYGEETLRQRYEQDKETLYRRPEKDGEKKDGEPPQQRDGEGRGGDGEGGKGPQLIEPQDPQDPQNPPPAQPQQPAPPAEQQGPPAQPTDQPTDQPQDTPAQDPYIPFEEVRARILATLQAEDVLRALWGKVQERMQAHLQAAIDARNAAAEAETAARNQLTEAEQALTQKPEDAEAKALVETTKQDVAAKETARKEAEQALDAARRAFSAKAVMTELAGQRKGFHVHTVAEPVGADGLRELGEFGTWPNTWMATAISTEGDLSTQVQAAGKGVFFFQIQRVVDRPLKPFDEIKEQLTTDYWKQQADEAAKQKAEAFEAALLRLGKEKRAERVTELEQEQATKTEQQFTEWRTKTEQALESARKELAGLPRESRSHRQLWEKQITKLETELAKADEKRQQLADQIAAETKQQIAAVAREAYPEVLAQAAEETGFTVTKVGPYVRNLREKPRFQHRYDETTRYLFNASTGGDEPEQVSSLEQGESSGLLDDATNRTLHLAVVTDVQKATVADVTRRELLSARESLIAQRLQGAISQSFTIDTLKQAYGYEAPKDQPVIDAPGGSGKGGSGTAPSGQGGGGAAAQVGTGTGGASSQSGSGAGNAAAGSQPAGGNTPPPEKKPDDKKPDDKKPDEKQPDEKKPDEKGR